MAKSADRMLSLPAAGEQHPGSSAAKTAFFTSRRGLQVEIRAICGDDEQRMITFHRGLSERSVYMRYFECLSIAARTAHARLARICFADPAQETVLVALYADSNGEQQIVAVGRLSRLRDPGCAEVALVVQDKFQGHGLGTELLRRLIDSAREQKIGRIQAEMLRDNMAIQKVLRKCGFRLRLTDPQSFRAVLNL